MASRGGDDDAFNLFGGPPAKRSSMSADAACDDTQLFPTPSIPSTSTAFTDRPFDLFPSKPVHPQRQDLDELFPTTCDTAPSSLPPRAVTLSRGESATPSLVQDEFKKAGNAMDIILVRNADGTSIGCTPWHVAFSFSRFLPSGVGDRVDVYCNGVQLPAPMVLGDKGRVLFASGREQPDDLTLAAISSILPMDFPPLYATLRFEHRKPLTCVVRVVECRMYLWDPDAAVVVADLDGTITINDVEGHIRTLRLGQYNFIHAGVCEFYARLHRIGLRILYLTARPINWADASRDHLDGAEQNGVRLPPGPLLTNSRGLTGALLTEVPRPPLVRRSFHERP
ncbi:hypothetical protein, variant [Aphanomyces invadans]|uniref:LNS2/PITP domain-containing protein n=1 Tax=Aphanomyces invadans TaxID=157072 RepID=A0A024TK44_9STRA|nr:hypothetical protein, variant [Aphanomyces invadans]ETV93976.1 hypothetical protein, variant [Aphanomyces invadans]|eukprot:XP_008877535.1 hypothetical protein, variant [Aphanomyces invadans]